MVALALGVGRWQGRWHWRWRNLLPLYGTDSLQYRRTIRCWNQGNASQSARNDETDICQSMGFVKLEGNDSKHFHRFLLWASDLSIHHSNVQYVVSMSDPPIQWLGLRTNYSCEGTHWRIVMVEDGSEVY